MYDRYYGLSGRPFQLTPDPQFYFESATHRKAMSYLGYGLAQGEGFIVITGEIGAGKSTLVAYLMASIDTARLTAAQIVTTQLPGDDLLHMVARAFGIDTQGFDKTATLKTIEHFLHEEARAGRRCLLVIDESQNLPVGAIEELRMLSNFQLGSHPLLQIFLLGQPEFRATVQRSPELEQLRQRVIAMHHLEAMHADEVQPYIEHRLSKVGWSGRPRITADAFTRLYEETNGIPRKLNSLANRLLLMGAIEQCDVIDATMVERVVDDLGRDMMSDPQWASDHTIGERVVAPDAEVPDRDEAKSPSDDSVAMPRSSPPPVQDVAEMRRQIEKLVAERAPLAMTAEPDLSEVFERIEVLESRQHEQEKALRRVLTLLIDWVEEDDLLAALHEQAA